MTSGATEIGSVGTWKIIVQRYAGIPSFQQKKKNMMHLAATRQPPLSLASATRASSRCSQMLKAGIPDHLDPRSGTQEQLTANNIKYVKRFAS